MVTLFPATRPSMRTEIVWAGAFSLPTTSVG